jgi:hypothetical protein
VRAAVLGAVVLAGCDLVFPPGRGPEPSVDAPPVCPVFAPPPFAISAQTLLAGTHPTVSPDETEMVFESGGALWLAINDPPWVVAGVLQGLSDTPQRSPVYDATSIDRLYYSGGTSGRVLAGSQQSLLVWANDPAPVIPGGARDKQIGAVTPPISGVRHAVISDRAQEDVGDDSTLELVEYTEIGGLFEEAEPPTMFRVNEAGFADRDPFLTADGCTVIFASDRDGDSALYFAGRTSPTEAFDSPVRLSVPDDASFAVTAPWLVGRETLYYTRIGGSTEIVVVSP